jgi:hypothetical protein
MFHESGYVHKGEVFPLTHLHTTKSKVTDVKLDNILVNYVEGDIRLSEDQLSDLAGTSPLIPSMQKTVL